MSKPYSDPVVDTFLRKVSLAAGIIFTLATILAVGFKAASVVMVTAFGAGAFLMLAVISYLTEQRIKKHMEKEQFKKLPVNQQLDIQLKQMRRLAGIDDKWNLQQEVETIEEQRKALKFKPRSTK